MAAAATSAAEGAGSVTGHGALLDAHAHHGTVGSVGRIRGPRSGRKRKNNQSATEERGTAKIAQVARSFNSLYLKKGKIGFSIGPLGSSCTWTKKKKQPISNGETRHGQDCSSWTRSLVLLLHCT